MLIFDFNLHEGTPKNRRKNEGKCPRGGVVTGARTEKRRPGIEQPSCKLKSKISIPRKKFQKNWKLIYTSNAIDWCKFQLFTSISGRAAIFWIWPSYTRISRENAACTNKVKRYCRGEARDQKNLKLTPVVRQHVGYPEIFFGVICLIHRAVSRLQTGRVLHIKCMAERPMHK